MRPPKHGRAIKKAKAKRPIHLTRKEYWRLKASNVNKSLDAFFKKKP